jgi:Mce-associated membrane protein
MDRPNDETNHTSAPEPDAPASASDDPAATASDAGLESAAAAAPPPGAKPLPDAPEPPKSLKTPLGERIRLPALTLTTVPTVILGVLVILLALMVFAPGILPFKVGAARTATKADTEADIERVSSRFARNLLTFDYRTLDEDLRRIAQDATGNFEREFEGVSAVSGNVIEAKAVSKGEVQGVSVSSQTGDSAVALVFLRRSIDNEEQDEPRTQFQFLELTLVNTAEGWKVDDVQDPTLAGL